jgi:hypothetical protein
MKSETRLGKLTGINQNLNSLPKASCPDAYQAPPAKNQYPKGVKDKHLKIR